MTTRKFLTLALYVPKRAPERLLRKNVMHLRLNEIKLLASRYFKLHLFDMVELILMRRCRKCGCTQNDCTQCIERTGAPCRWVASDLCSACETSKPK